MKFRLHCPCLFQTFRWEEDWPTLPKIGQNWAKLGRDHRRQVRPFCSKKGVQNSVSNTSNSVTRPSLLPAASKSAAGRRSRQSPLKGGSGGDDSGKSRIILQNFPRSQEERETQADYRPLCAQPFCLHRDIQNGDTEKSERLHSVKRLGIFIGSDGLLFACPDTSSVSQIPQIHAGRSSVPVQGTPIRPLDKSFLVYTPYATFLRKRAITLHPYLDDWLSRNQNRRRLLEHRQFILSLITSLGLIINYEKSDLVPAQEFTFIGMEFLTHTNIIRVPQTRQMKILETVRMVSQKTSISARDFLSLLGQLNAAADFVMLGRLHLRPLQMSLHNQWQPQKLLLCHQICMTTEILQHLKWWLQEDRYPQGVPLKIDPPFHTIFTDASLSGWGARGTGGASVSWTMDRRPIPAPHQCAGDESNFSLSITSSSQGKELHCFGVNGQHDSGSLYKASGRDSFHRTLRGSMERPELVLSPQHTSVSEAHTG